MWRALSLRLLQRHSLAQCGAQVHLPAQGVRLSAVDERLAQKIAPQLAQRGELHQVVKDLVYASTSLAQLAALVRQMAAAHAGEVTAATYRDATQLGRKRAIQLLEYSDRIGLLRRVGDVHRLRQDPSLSLGDDAHDQ